MSEYNAVWSILMVDDDPQTHLQVGESLGAILVDGKPVRVSAALNAEHARQVITNNGPFHMVIIGADVSCARARLELVRWLREGHLDCQTQIIIATDSAEDMARRQISRLGYDGVSVYPKSQLIKALPVAQFVAALRIHQTMAELWPQTALARALFPDDSMEQAPTAANAPVAPIEQLSLQAS